jgi:hypothetical protein
LLLSSNPTTTQLPLLPLHPHPFLLLPLLLPLLLLMFMQGSLLAQLLLVSQAPYTPLFWMLLLI